MLNKISNLLKKIFILFFLFLYWVLTFLIPLISCLTLSLLLSLLLLTNNDFVITVNKMIFRKN